MLALLAFSSVLPGCLADRTSWPKVNYWEEEGVDMEFQSRGTSDQGHPQTETTARTSSSQGQTQILEKARLAK